MKVRRLIMQAVAIGILILCGTAHGRAAPLYRPTPAAAPIVLGFIGDSITHNTPHGGTLNPPHATAALLSAWLTNPHVTVIDASVPGTGTHDWLPSLKGYFYQTARAYFIKDHVQWVMIMLGTNDARRPYRYRGLSAYRTNLRAITSDLVAHGFKVLLNAPPYAQPGGLDGEIDEQSTRWLQVDGQVLPSLTVRGHIWMGDTMAYPYFATHPEMTVDGVHPNAAGVTALAQMWAVAYLHAIGIH